MPARFSWHFCFFNAFYPSGLNSIKLFQNYNCAAKMHSLSIRKFEMTGICFSFIFIKIDYIKAYNQFWLSHNKIKNTILKDPQRPRSEARERIGRI